MKVRSVVNTILKILAGFVCVLFVAAFLFPMFARAKMGGKSRCRNNLTRIDREILMYASDNDDRLPIASAWMDEIEGPYNGLEPVFYDLLAVPAGAYGYAFRDKASTLKIADVEKPGSFALIFDSVQLQRNAHSEPSSLPRPGRHDGFDNVGFLDGHVKKIPMP